MTNFRIKYSFFLLLIILIFINACNSTQTLKPKLTNKNVMSKNKNVTVNTTIKNFLIKNDNNYNLNPDSKITKKKIRSIK